MINKLKRIVKIFINYDQRKLVVHPNDLVQFNRVQPWFKDNGDTTLRLNYDLNENSIVMDLGGYKGEFAADIYCKYSPTIFIFEPILNFYEIINNKFLNSDRVNRYPFGLAASDGNLKISLTDNSSSVYIDSDEFEIIQLKSIVTFLKDNNITKVDLIKINIEGGEYEILESLIQHNMIAIFTNIQVQFHDFLIDDAKDRMNRIQKELSKSHDLTYQYEFVWENWKLK